MSARNYCTCYKHHGVGLTLVYHVHEYITHSLKYPYFEDYAQACARDRQECRAGIVKCRSTKKKTAGGMPR